MPMTIEEAIRLASKGYYSICNDGLWKGFRFDPSMVEKEAE